MAACHHYCERCGEDSDGDSIRCDECGIEMCCNCATRDEIATEECAKCRGKKHAAERESDLRAQLTKVLPCMRQWFEKNMIRGPR